MLSNVIHFETSAKVHFKKLYILRLFSYIRNKYTIDYSSSVHTTLSFVGYGFILNEMGHTKIHLWDEKRIIFYDTLWEYKVISEDIEMFP